MHVSGKLASVTCISSTRCIRLGPTISPKRLPQHTGPTCHWAHIVTVDLQGCRKYHLAPMDENGMPELTLCLVDCNFPFTACHLPCRLCPKLYQVLRPARSQSTISTPPSVGFERTSFSSLLPTFSNIKPFFPSQSLACTQLCIPA